MSEVCGDNRFELIGEFKGKLVEGTNIGMSPEEMAVLDNFLFRIWQMGWLDKLKAQEPHIITKKDFENNPSVDENGYLPAYCEKIDRPIGWMAIHKGYIGVRKDIRYWTGKPTADQREAVKWE